MKGEQLYKPPSEIRASSACAEPALARLRGAAGIFQSGPYIRSSKITWLFVARGCVSVFFSCTTLLRGLILIC